MTITVPNIHGSVDAFKTGKFKGERQTFDRAVYTAQQRRLDRGESELVHDDLALVRELFGSRKPVNPDVSQLRFPRIEIVGRTELKTFAMAVNSTMTHVLGSLSASMNLEIVEQVRLGRDARWTGRCQRTVRVSNACSRYLLGSI